MLRMPSPTTLSELVVCPMAAIVTASITVQTTSSSLTLNAGNNH